MPVVKDAIRLVNLLKHNGYASSQKNNSKRSANSFGQSHAQRLQIAMLSFLHGSTKKKKKLPPGPRGVPNLGLLHMIGKNIHQDLHRIAQKHVLIMYMQFGFVSNIVVSSPHAAEKFLKAYDLVLQADHPHQAFKCLSWDQIWDSCIAALKSVLSNLREGKSLAFWLNGSSETKDIVDTMISIMQSRETEFQLDRRHVKAIMLDMLVASMDSWTLQHQQLSGYFPSSIKNPQVMKKVQKELEEAVGLDRMVEESDLETLEYLDMVVKETFRLHPVAPLLIPHYSLEDCTKFNPEMLVGSSIDVRGQHFQLLPFGSGRRGCPGMQLGLIMVRLIVAQLVHCFDWKLPNNMLPSELDMTEEFGLVVTRADHLMAVPTCRLQK
ncbi:cytochrome P450 CYP736A12-like [Olea europaea subsp. europaea]|uniref:Cytochrome P450 CYP736A12-like n=1 Tax=Olea europaea subsp. europaea TaxID=158383 RepID=A0A8S0Q821_OLEEU|nr:cytochrome P450 CYP736A12-like [Olea europaea subsp. europaea]